MVAVCRRRTQLGLPAPDPKWRNWRPEDDKILGTRPDKEVALLLRRSTQAVKARRIELGIAYTNATFRRWSEKENRLIGTLADKEVAQILRRSADAVKAQRLKLGRPAFSRTKKLRE